MNIPQRQLLVVGALLALCATAAIALSSGGGDERGPGFAPPDLAGADSAEGSTGILRTSDARFESPEVGGPARSVADLSGDETVVEPGTGIAITVVAAADSQPLAGAEVWFAEMRLRGGAEEIGRRLAQIERDGQRVVTDRDGIATLPAPRREFAAFARYGELFGVGRVRRDRENQSLRLQLDESLTVRVVGPDRDPQPGIDVVLAADRIRSLTRQKQVKTDADGLAVFEHVQLYRRGMPQVEPNIVVDATNLANQAAMLQQLRSAQRAQSGTSSRELIVELRRSEELLRATQEKMRELERQAWRDVRQRREAGQPTGPMQWSDFLVTARVPQVAPQPLRIKAREIPDGIVELQLGGVGSVEARVLGPGGHPVWMPCEIRVGRSRANPPAPNLEAGTFEQLRRLTGLSAEKPAGSAPVTLGPIGAGTVLDFAVEFEDDDFNFRQQAVVGPATGTTLRVDLQAPDWFTVLAGRMVDRSGTPLAGLRAELLLSGATGRIEGEPLTTDADGCFELPLRLREPRPPYTLEIQSMRGDTPAGALIAVPDLRAGERRDLGDVLVEELPLLVSGLVADDRGEPIEAASARLQVFHRAIGEEGAWRDVAYVRARTGEDGRYELYGEARSEPMRVEIRARGHSGAESPPLQIGATYDVRLDRLGAVVATGFAPEWLPRRAVNFELRQNGERVRRDDFEVRRNQTFREGVGGLRPGNYEFVATLEGFGVLESMPNVYVGAGETVQLPPIDLRGRLFKYRVQCVDGQGQAMSDPGSPLLAQVAGRDGQLRWSAFAWRGNYVEFISSQPTTEVVLLARGRRPARSLIAPGESQMTLESLPPVQVEMPGLRQMLGERRARISLVRVGDTGLPMADLRSVDQGGGRGRSYARASLGKSTGAFLGDGDVVTMPVMLEGDYNVVVRLYGSGQPRVVSKTIGQIRVRFPGGGQPARGTVQVPPRVIQEALLELGA